MPHERSIGGCWSCRIRKKKCDEQYPICVNCSSRAMTCHGYGLKPNWMDGDEEERKVLRALREEVRKSLKQRKALGQTAPGLSLLTPPSAETTPTSCLPADSTRETDFNYALLPPRAVNSSSTSLIAEHQNPTAHNLLLGSTCDALPHVDPGRLKDHESALLMNYLDQVFPLQFNCYVPTVMELGRGWLLALLTRTKPLYHAALAISAFHIKCMLANSEKDRTHCIGGHDNAMRMHHDFAFQGLQLQIASFNEAQEDGNIGDRLEILACIVQMMSFELLRGGSDHWMLHLKAAASFVPALTAERNTHTSSKSITAQYSERMERGECPPDVNEIAADFLVGTILWYDILATASNRSSPFLPDNVDHIGNIELDKVMGCRNWVMIIIAQISALEIWKLEMQKNERLSVVELGTRGSEIAQLLDSGLATQSIGAPAPVFSKSAARYSPLITQIFALSAFTYLHVVVSGAYPELAEIKRSVSMTMTALSSLPEPQLLQNLFWPFCITGCMASRDHEQTLTTMVSMAGENATCPGNYWRVLEIIRECWRLREENKADDGKGVDWVRAMKSLGLQPLLV